jgi:hypothetical protein
LTVREQKYKAVAAFNRFTRTKEGSSKRRWELWNHGANEPRRILMQNSSESTLKTRTKEQLQGGRRFTS